MPFVALALIYVRSYRRKAKRMKEVNRTSRLYISLFKICWKYTVGHPPSTSHQLTEAVFRIRIHRIHMFLGLLDPDPDPLVRCMDPVPVPDPSIIMQK